MIQFTVYISCPFARLLEGKAHPCDILALEAHPFSAREFHSERAWSVFYPSDARVPEALRTGEFLLRPLRATDVTLDYDAVISSRAELLLGSGGTWPREG